MGPPYLTSQRYATEHNSSTYRCFLLVSPESDREILLHWARVATGFLRACAGRCGRSCGRVKGGNVRGKGKDRSGKALVGSPAGAGRLLTGSDWALAERTKYTGALKKIYN